MKKLLLTIIISFAITHGFAQSWQATNLTNVAYLPINSMESHNNELYASVNTGFGYYFYRMNSNQTSWTQLSPVGITGTPALIKSLGNRLYISTVSGFSSNVYYSNDNAATWIPDTVGIPDAALAVGLFGAKSKIVVITHLGFYIKDTAVTAWQHIDVPTALGGSDLMTAANDSLYAYDNSGANAFYVSGNDGANWTQRTSNLPVDFQANVLTPDLTTGRLYIAGAWNSQANTGIYYSDNGGASWTLFTAANAYISTNANNTPQLVKSMYANGNTFYMGLENNKANTAPDIIGSMTGIGNLAYDTIGLPAGAAGLYGAKFLMHKNELLLSLVVIDVYRRGAPAGVQDAAMKAVNKVFPNPASGKLYFDDVMLGTQARIMNEEGKVVKMQAVSSSAVDIADLPKGLYFIQLVAKDKVLPMQKFIKE